MSDSNIVRLTPSTATVELREATTENPDPRTVYGLAVPYNEVAEIAPGVYEKILPGAFAGSQHVILRTEHGVTIGSVQTREAEDGLYIEAPISKIAAGEEALTMIRDQVWDRLSAGYQPLSGGSYMDDDGVIVRSKARLLEVSLTGIPAYENAKVLALREAGRAPAKEGIEMTEKSPELVQLTAEVQEVREANADLTRQISLIAQPTSGTKVIGGEYRSAAEWIKGMWKGEESAKSLQKHVLETRVFAGTTSGDTTTAVPAWVNNQIRTVAQNRIAFDTFAREALPATGMSLEYLTLASSTLQVQKQAAEGDVLAFGKLTLGSGSASVDTYGGYSSASLQALKRSPINVLETTYSLLELQAAYRSNTAFIAALAAGASGYQSVTRAGAGTPTLDNWIDAILDAEFKLTALGMGMPAEGILMSLDVFKATAKVRDGANRLMDIDGFTGYGTSVGTVDAIGVRGRLLGLPVRVDPGLANGTCYVYNSQAIKNFGDATPSRLGPDDDVTNLTSEFSVYFLQATAPQFPQAIVKIVPSA